MSQLLDENLRKLSKKQQKLWALRHTAEHVLHTAMQNLFPKLKKAMGPATPDGFYFDFDLDQKISDEDFPKIEKEMRRLIKENLPMSQEYIDAPSAAKIFKKNPYKMDWIEQIEKRKEKISIYKMGKEDLDLCSGPHVDSTGKVEAFKLLSVAGAYWHGNENNKMLQRIYGVAYPSQKELDDYLIQAEEAKKRDHRKLGQELDLFSTNQLTGAGLILWHPKLAVVREVVENFWKEEHRKNGYQLVYTPHIASVDMFTISRHLSKYVNSMFPVMMHEFIEGESAPDYLADEVLKPMNCPNHIQIFKNHQRSYRDLPIRMGELGTVYRYERAGVLHGMTRVRGFTQDDTHIFCRPEQVVEEVRGVIKLTQQIYKAFGFKDYQVYIATKPEKYLGSAEMWEFAESALKKAAEAEGLDYKIDEGEGVFYGPKIDSKVKDSIGREWQLGTIQFDFNQPMRGETTAQDIDEFWALKYFKRRFKNREGLAEYLNRLGRGFDVKFINDKGKEENVVMVHRTILGSMERFFGVLIEHYGGAFPVWLSPVQVKILPITDRNLDYATEVLKKLRNEDIRVELDDRNETLQAKIRDAQNQKVSYMLIIGDKEQAAGTVSERGRSGKNYGPQKLEKFIKNIKKEIETKSLD